ncbi:MAG TPA: hypothetical protein VFT98_12985 [Myxococcota bacterium]|nr:hypothetical protein [Myxococcota bacterium]
MTRSRIAIALLCGIAAHAALAEGDAVRDVAAGAPHEARTLSSRADDRFAFDAQTALRAAFLVATRPELAPPGHTRALLQSSALEAITYARVPAPMIADRDVATRVVIEREGERARLRWREANEHAPPLPPGVVRIARSRGMLELIPDGPCACRVRHEAEVDPGESLPLWLARRFFAREMEAQRDQIRALGERLAGESGTCPRAGVK